MYILFQTGLLLTFAYLWRRVGGMAPPLSSSSSSESASWQFRQSRPEPVSRSLIIIAPRNTNIPPSRRGKWQTGFLSRARMLWFLSLRRIWQYEAIMVICEIMRNFGVFCATEVRCAKEAVNAETAVKSISQSIFWAKLEGDLILNSVPESLKIPTCKKPIHYG